MIERSFNFVVEVYHRGVVLGRAAAGIGMCTEDMLFESVIRGGTANVEPFPALAVAPLWGQKGPPTVSGISVTLSGEPQRRYALEIFAPYAKALAADLAAQKKVTAGEVVEWAVVAESRPSGRTRFKARSSHARYPLGKASLPCLPPGSLSVTVEQQVLDQVSDLFLSSPSAESAGLLVGRLMHDSSQKVACLTVTRQIALAAGRGGTSSCHFAFDTQTFMAARHSLGDLNENSTIAGWWHTHPACTYCPKAKECPVETVFFSSADFKVQASAFAAPYMVALVGGKLRNGSPDKPGFRLYGWEGGLMLERPLSPAGPTYSTPSGSASVSGQRASAPTGESLVESTGHQLSVERKQFPWAPQHKDRSGDNDD